MVKIQMRGECKMRFYNIYYLCNSLLKEFTKQRIVNKTANTEYYILDWKEYVEALAAVRQIPMFKETSDEIYETIPVFVREKEKPVIDQETKNCFVQKNNELIRKMSAIIELYESMNLQEAKNGIDVKIPACTELKEYISYLKEIDFIFTQCPFLVCSDEKISFCNVDIGSNWLSFLVEVAAGAAATSYILTNIAKLIDKALALKSHYLSIKEQEEILKSRRIKNELTEQEKEIFKELQQYHMKKFVSELEEEIEPLSDGEQKGKVEKSLEKLCELLDKGVEIYASLDVPKDVQVLFPELGDTEKLPDNILKLLEDKEGCPAGQEEQSET